MSARDRILDLVRTQPDGYPPTVRELMAAAGLNSPASVQYHLERLERDGLISREAGKVRTIVATPEAMEETP